MKLAFTICSNNYLAQAKILIDSLHSTNPEYKLYIFLVDELSEEINYSLFKATIIPISELKLERYHIFAKYNIIELNTCIKPSCFKYIFNKHKGAEHAHYFDPDIQVFVSLNEIDNYFNDDSILLTPHILTPNNQFDSMPSENLFLMYGIFNLGYIGLKSRDPDVFSFLDWWEYRTLNFGYNKQEEGFFVDQLWVNFIPVFYQDKTKILLSPGYNMAPWNLHERDLKIDGGGITVNGNSKLIFYHFSSYSFDTPDRIAKNNKYTFEGREDLKKLYGEYHQLLINNKVEFLSCIACAFFSSDSDKFEVIEINPLSVPSLAVFYTGIEYVSAFFLPPVIVYLFKQIKKMIK